jgi:hypothetical protein
MTSVSAGRAVHSRRVQLAVGTAAAASDPAPFCSEPYDCVQAGAAQLVPPGFEPLSAYRPATWNSGMPS